MYDLSNNIVADYSTLNDLS